MMSVRITYMVENMDEVTETLEPVVESLHGVAIPPVGSRFVKSMANEQGSTVHVEVQLVPETDAAMLKKHKPSDKIVLHKN